MSNQPFPRPIAPSTGQQCIILKNPRRRAFSSVTAPLSFNPGLAVARTMYLLSASNRLAPIEYYSESVRRFSDDGKTINGSAYGHRIFGGDGHPNQFLRCAELIRDRPNTKRAAISIYLNTDAGRVSKDIPCALGIAFLPRKTLAMTVIMRANDTLKLLPYNIFEFTVLGECMAAQTGFELGEYSQFSVSQHLRGEGISIGARLSKEAIDDSPEMSMIRDFSDELRKGLVAIERDVRVHQISFDEIERRCRGYDDVWADMFYVLRMEADRRLGASSSGLRSKCEALLNGHNRYTLLKGYASFLSAIQSQGTVR